MAVRTQPRRRCSCCGKNWLEARMIQKAQTTYGDLSTVVFRKTLACFLCPVCDVGAERKDALHPPE